MGVKWSTYSSPCTYRKAVCYSGPYLVFIDHLLDACGHYELSQEERDSYQKLFSWRCADDVLIQALLYGGCYKKNRNLLNVLPVEKVVHKCMAFLHQEANVQANKRFGNQSRKVIATVADDKKYQDSALNRSTRFNRLGFRKVEVDTAPYRVDVSNGAQLAYKTLDFDYNEFRNVEEAWEKIVDRLPQGMVSPELKFRKLGKHKATGLYHPTFNIIAVDVRDTSMSLVTTLTLPTKVVRKSVAYKMILRISWLHIRILCLEILVNPPILRLQRRCLRVVLNSGYLRLLSLIVHYSRIRGLTMEPLNI